MKFYILAIFILFNYISCLKYNVKYNELCQLTQKQCRGFYDFIKGYKVQCTRSNKCVGEFGFSCDTEYCAKSEANCQEFLKLNYYHQTLGFNKLDSIHKQVRPCPARKVEFNSEDACKNGENCQIVQVFAMRYGVWRVAKPVDCPCNGNFTFVCGNQYCTRDKAACDALIMVKAKQDENIIIKSCENDNLISYHYS